MRSSNPFSQAAASPDAPIGQLARWVLDTTFHCVLGLVVGMAVARMLRSRELHWSWAATSVVPLLLLRASLGSWTLAAMLAGLSATKVGRRWHREDIAAGADLARVAARRRGPLSLLRASFAGVDLHPRGTRRADACRIAGRLILGADERGRAISIPFAGEGGGRHMLVVGATGSGKTVTQTLLATRAIEQGMGAVIVDPKGDCDMREQLRLAASIAGRPFIEWTPGGPSVYNPYACGGETEIADKALAGERFTEPHYQRQAQRYLGHVVRALRENAIEVSLCAIVEHLDPDRLETLARTLPESHAAATHAYLDSLTTRQRSDLAGVRDRLAILTESDVGPWLDPQASAAERFDLLGATRARAVVYFNLQSDSRPLLTQILGAAIVQDLQTTVASLQGRPVPTLVVIDEFSAVSAEHVVRLFGRARSAGLSLLLGTQELSDLRPPGRERLLEQVMGNLTVLIAHRQVVPASAELIASVAGSRGAWKVARHSDGRTTRTRTSEPILDPNEVRTLDPGSAAVIVLGGGGGVAIGRVLSPLQVR
ncbi:MAG: Type secretory pathway VirD4 component-like protein [Solirubrobacterales bacterium]|nr:Type secretory pathway VirD4 component-like protein [Solirubrobacterales bacterium]